MIITLHYLNFCLIDKISANNNKKGLKTSNVSYKHIFNINIKTIYHTLHQFLTITTN